MKGQRGKLAFWVGMIVTTALVAVFTIAGTAVAQVDGVDNEVETCVGESCNSGNVAEVEVDNDCIIAAVNVGVIVGDSGLIINDACNTDVTVTQSQIFEEEEIIEVVTPAPVAAAAAPAAVAGAAALPKTGLPALALGLLGSGLSATGLLLWRRSR